MFKCKRTYLQSFKASKRNIVRKFVCSLFFHDTNLNWVVSFFLRFSFWLIFVNWKTKSYFSSNTSCFSAQNLTPFFFFKKNLESSHEKQPFVHVICYFETQVFLAVLVFKTKASKAQKQQFRLCFENNVRNLN